MRVILAIGFSIVMSCTSIPCIGQAVESLKFEELYSSISKNNDTLYILNFWATWCKPCIEELPFFEKVNEENKKESLKLILVNLDFHSKVESSVKPFMARKNIRSSVVHVTDTDPNEWISKIDERWSGAIPATVMYLNGKTQFFKEGKLTYEELKAVTDSLLSKRE